MPNANVLLDLQNRLQLDPPLRWGNAQFSALSDVEARFLSEEEFALNVLDYVLHQLATDVSVANKVRSILVDGGSAWGVDSAAEGGFQLIARQGGPVRELIEAVKSASEVAHQHLNDAWLQANAHNPNPSDAYGDAVKAVEAAAVPIVLPNDRQATLGKVIRELRANPSRWIVAIDGMTIDDLVRQCEILWKGQTDRHAPANAEVQPEDARAAVYLAVFLTGLFVERLVVPAT